uniref:Protein unc-50 homolog n=1 Tax=Hirondellea gigas TaxID=1518452 RepID=A0A2P2I278_9CRUS
MSAGVSSVADNFQKKTRTESVTSVGSHSSIPLSYRSLSPLPIPATHRNDCMTAAAKRYRYLRRLFKFRQMDFEFAAWQMVYLFIAPQKVFRNSLYRKQTKAQFARDDPAFVVLLCLWLCVTTLGFGVVLALGFFDLIVFLLYTVFIDTLLTGCVVASVLWFLVNHYLVKPTCFDQDVEWGYAFDVHLNAYFPSLIILHFFQLFFYHILLQHDWFVSVLFGNTLWLLSVGYYIYITFLGYSALSILHKSRTFLYALPVVASIYLLSLVCQWNLCRALVRFYHYRVL